MTDDEWFIQIVESLFPSGQPVKQLERYRIINAARQEHTSCPCRNSMLLALELMLPTIDAATNARDMAQQLILKLKAGITINGDVNQGSGSTIGNDHSSNKKIETEDDDESRKSA